MVMRAQSFENVKGIISRGMSANVSFEQVRYFLVIKDAILAKEGRNCLAYFRVGVIEEQRKEFDTPGKDPLVGNRLSHDLGHPLTLVGRAVQGTLVEQIVHPTFMQPTNRNPLCSKTNYLAVDRICH